MVAFDIESGMCGVPCAVCTWSSIYTANTSLVLIIDVLLSLSPLGMAMAFVVQYASLVLALFST